MAKDNLKQLFSLPADEEIFDDFQCKEGFTGSGRLYLTSGHMCYFSSLLGITKKIVIKWQNIKSLEKDQKQGIRVHKDSGESILFTGFSERGTSLKFIKRLWSSQSSHADGLDSDDDDEEDDGLADELLKEAALNVTASAQQQVDQISAKQQEAENNRQQ